MILFTRDDLESDPIFASKPPRDRPVPHDHPLSFRDFAENSRALYYPMPPRERSEDLPRPTPQDPTP